MPGVAEVRVGASWVVQVMDDGSDDQGSYLPAVQHVLNMATCT